MTVPLSALFWSGGKDSALALQALREAAPPGPHVLVTTVTPGYERIAVHRVRRELLLAQAAAAALTLVEVEIPSPCPNEVYEQRLAAALAGEPLRDVTTLAFGDLFLEEIRAYRERWLTGLGRDVEFPLWGRDTGSLARQFIAEGYEAVVVCVDSSQLDPGFIGRAFDPLLLADLPAGVDPCGENGEFHTFVHAGPVFSQPIAWQPGDVVEREGFVFYDILPG